jgi:hypothetical protein
MRYGRATSCLTCVALPRRAFWMTTIPIATIAGTMGLLQKGQTGSSSALMSRMAGALL